MEQEAKLVREWFNELPKKYRKKAFKKATEDALNDYADNLTEALIFSFNVGSSYDGDPLLLSFFDEVESKFNKMTNSQLYQTAKEFLSEGYISEEYFSKNLINKDLRKFLIEIEMIVITFELIDVKI